MRGPSARQRAQPRRAASRLRRALRERSSRRSRGASQMTKAACPAQRPRAPVAALRTFASKNGVMKPQTASRPAMKASTPSQRPRAPVPRITLRRRRRRSTRRRSRGRRAARRRCRGRGRPSAWPELVESPAVARRASPTSTSAELGDAAGECGRRPARRPVLGVAQGRPEARRGTRGRGRCPRRSAARTTRIALRCAARNAGASSACLMFGSAGSPPGLGAQEDDEGDHEEERGEQAARGAHLVPGARTACSSHANLDARRPPAHRPDGMNLGIASVGRDLDRPVPGGDFAANW